MASVFGPTIELEPIQILDLHRDELFRRTSRICQVRDPAPQLFTLMDDDGSMLTIHSPASATVAELLNAERINLDWNQAGALSLDGVNLPLSTVIDSMPAGLAMVANTHQGRFYAEMVPGGCWTLHLRPFGFHFIHFLQDENGKSYGAECRVWRSLSLTTIPPAEPAKFWRAGGEAELSFKLRAGHVSSAFQAIVGSLPEQIKPLIIDPVMAHKIFNFEIHQLTNHGLNWNQSDGRII